MSKSKKTATAPTPMQWNWGMLLHAPPTRRLLLVLVSLSILGMLFSAAWRHWGPTILQSPQYVLAADQIDVTPQPAWIHANVKADAVRAGQLAGLSILDPKLTEKVQNAFAVQTWVARVKRVMKQHPARVIVELEYRRPIAMVQVSDGDMRGLLPIDVYSVLLPPEDFSQSQVPKYLRIVVGPTQPEGPVGTPWGNDRVASAAVIAAALDEHWQRLELYSIVLALPPQGELPGTPTFDLLTRDGARVIWGHAPGQEQSGEATTKEKLAALEKYYTEHGPLTGEQRVLNVRDGN